MDLLQLIGAMSRATANKVAVEQKRLPIVTATALSIDRTIDAYPHVRCHVDGNPASQVDIVPIATGADWQPGQRITIEYTHPSGAWAHGPTLGSNVAYHCAKDCGSGTEPEACVTFTLDKQEMVSIVYALDSGSIDHWEIDGVTVTSPTGPAVATAALLDAGEHTICVLGAETKSTQCVSLVVSTGGGNITDADCIEFEGEEPTVDVFFDETFLLIASDSVSPASGGSGFLDAFTTLTDTTVNIGAVLQSVPAPGGFNLNVSVALYDEFSVLIQSQSTLGDASAVVFVNMTLGSPIAPGHYLLNVSAILTPNYWQTPITPPDPARTVHWTGSINP